MNRIECLDVSDFQELSLIQGEDEEETLMLRQMAGEAVSYIGSFDWAKEVHSCHLAYGVGGIFALFLIKFVKPISEEDICLWVVVGDIPSAYFVIDNAKSVNEAIRIYCEMMRDWSKSVTSGTDLEVCFPVEAAATEENARNLLSRLDFIESNLLPAL